MKLLIFTQKVDMNDSILGFFHSWLCQFALHTESITVICLEERAHTLPKNVTVLSLGKEYDVGRFEYVRNLYRHLQKISGTYDTVFVHMNQEYVLLGGLYWKLKHIPVYLWRNHPRGGIGTRIAVALSTGVFCTSAQSFTARFKKTRIMPVGIDTRFFVSVKDVIRKKYSACIVGRISPIKHIELALKAVDLFINSGGQISLAIIGSVSPQDREYAETLRTYIAHNDLVQHVTFLDAVPSSELPKLYSAYEVCFNMTESGSFDKTIVEAAACGAIPIVANSSLAGVLPPECMTEPVPEAISEAITRAFNPHVQIILAPKLQTFALSHSLANLTAQLLPILENRTM